MTLKIWTNTKTLDDYTSELKFTGDTHDADVALLGSKPIQLNDFPKLKGIFRAGIGRDNVPTEQAAAQGVVVRFPGEETVKIIFDETANFACSLIFHMMYQAVGELETWTKFNRQPLSKKRLLVLGHGAIGSRVTKKMNEFMDVQVYDVITHTPEDLLEFIPMADVISLHIPNSQDNAGFFDSEKIKLMKTGATLINTARGNVVEEDALYDAIKAEKITAAFDVFWQEPYHGKLKAFHPRSFYMTPHVASTCSAFLEGCFGDLKRLIKELSDAS